MNFDILLSLNSHLLCFKSFIFQFKKQKFGAEIQRFHSTLDKCNGMVERFSEKMLHVHTCDARQNTIRYDFAWNAKCLEPN